MKGACALAASLVASASTLAFSSSLHEFTPTGTTPSSALLQEESRRVRSAQNAACREDKFAPKFDGLRFIETLITAHR